MSVVGSIRGRGRPARVIGAMLVMLALVGSALSPTAGAARETDGAARLDMAAMVLTPADLARAGQEGFGVSFGRTLAADDLADRAVWPAGEGEALAEVRTALGAAGWRQGYHTLLTTIRAAAAGPIRDVEIEVVAYADAEGAAAGFSLVPDAYATGEMEEIAGAETIGDESRVTRVAARDPGSGTAYPELAIGFRHERLTARILIRNLEGGTPEIEEIEALGEALLTKIERGLGAGGPGLSLRALRVEPRDEGTVGTDAYLRLDGEDRQSAFETEAAFADRAAEYGEATDVFASATEIAANDSGYNLAFGTILSRFATEYLAAAWLGGASDRLRQAPDVTGFAAGGAGDGLGDEAAAVTMARDAGGDGLDISHSAVVVIRVATVVAEIRLERAYDAPPPAAALDLAREQAACLEADVCLRVLPAPLSLTGGLNGDAYAGHGGDPAACLSSVTYDVLAGATKGHPAEDAGGVPIAGEDDGWVFAAFTYTVEVPTSEQPLIEERAGWFACRTLVAGEAVLAVQLVTADRDVFLDHLALLPDLLGRVEPPASAGSLLDLPSG